MKMSCEERMRFKRWVCLLGSLLLLFLLLGRMIMHFRMESMEQPSEPHVPQIEILKNVWLIEIGEDNILLYRDEQEESYDLGMREDGSLYQPDWGNREQIADVVLTDGRVTEVQPHLEKVHGVILSADADMVEVQGYGRLPLASDYKGYRIYNTLSMCTIRDIVFGYDFTDLVLKDGEICGILIVKEETMEEIRVLIKTADFGGNLHEELELTCDTDFMILHGEQTQSVEKHSAGEEVVITADSAYFDGGRILIEPTVLTGKIRLKNVHRSQGTPEYRGRMELVKESGEKAGGAQKGFVVINTVLLEDYLYSVVPSEMPASYELEALKAQAICARTYAYGHMRHAAYPAYGAHVDDSTAYQVYNNILEQASTTKAVKETHGQLLYAESGELAETYYYSTSCGVGSDAGIWKNETAQGLDYLKAQAIRKSGEGAREGAGSEREKAEAARTETQEIGEYLRDEEHFREFITRTDPADFEAGENWYRWSYTVQKPDAKRMYETLTKRYQVRPELVLTKTKSAYESKEPKKFSQIKGISIAARGSGGVADELILETDQGTYKVISEYNIRSVLCDGVTKAKLSNGNEVEMANLLPSGFFVLETSTGKNDENVVGYTIIGGGFGHGVGMSQNAARRMAEQGYQCEQILLFFYENCQITAVYSNE